MILQILLLTRMENFSIVPQINFPLGRDQWFNGDSLSAILAHQLHKRDIQQFGLSHLTVLVLGDHEQLLVSG